MGSHKIYNFRAGLQLRSSQVARITGMSHWQLGEGGQLIKLNFTVSSKKFFLVFFSLQYGSLNAGP
jgi:hypothetical protein